MSKVIMGRMTHHYEGELVVFHIGMQINRWWRPDVWLPAFFAMPRMLRELSQDDGSGFLGYELLFGRGGPYVVQYWSSVDKLYAYSTSPSQEHRPAWTKFNQAARKSPGTVGVWHETFLVERAESIYVSTREMGLPKATELVEVGRRQDRAKARFDEGRTVAEAERR
ncbi:DUF4188 domain-containing protein [Microbacterium sp.]|uniref:DUF4188 domain-containing protein n=1 Tax=Microbacterium sp. TaxID=51671 RepID=UPI002C9572B3|nr:DUF4188 domain-containing protein [Microbacterium sp.]HWK76775.1 DUF4188 domain-containing protein [Microbacterium sp.]